MGQRLASLGTMLSPGPGKKGRLWFFTRFGFGITALVFLIGAFLRGLEDAQGEIFPSLGQVALASALLLLGLLAAGRSWSYLFPDSFSRRPIERGFYLAQVAKYIPGTIWQPLAQATSARRAAGSGLAQASGTVVLHMLLQLASGATIGASVALVTSAPNWIRSTSLAGLASVLLLRRRWMVVIVEKLGRLLGRSFRDQAVPAQRLIVASYLCSILTILAGGTAFSILWSGFHAAPMPKAVSTFALAWTIGFLAIPFPSGIGIREGVLIATLGVAGSQAAVIAASVAHRVATIVAELLCIAYSLMPWRKRRGYRS